MDFSIVVPFFNAEPFIERCIEGVLGQSYSSDRYEVLMVDNNSTDGSAAIVRRHSRVKLIQESEQGSYAARNRGVIEARGEILAFTDPDCVPRRNWLEETLLEGTLLEALLEALLEEALLEALLEGTLLEALLGPKARDKLCKSRLIVPAEKGWHRDIKCKSCPTKTR